MNLPEFNPSQHHLLHKQANVTTKKTGFLSKLKVAIPAALLLLGVNLYAAESGSNAGIIPSNNNDNLTTATQSKISRKAWVLYQMNKAMSMMAPAWHTSHYSHSSHSSHSSHHSHYSSRY